jgi:hypothetical protein
MGVRLILATALTALHGTFGTTLTRADLRAVGASSREAGWAVGTWTLVAGGGRWTLRQRGGVDGNTVDRGRIDGTRFVLTSADGFAHNEDVGRLRWTLRGPTLRFAAVELARNRDIVQILTARPWRRR